MPLPALCRVAAIVLLALAPAAAQVTPADEAGWSRPFSPGIVQFVTAAAPLPDGRIVYVSRTTSPTEVNRLLEWDGQRIHERDAGSSYYTGLVALSNGRLFASRGATGLDEWTGAGWSPLPAGGLNVVFVGPGDTLCTLYTTTTTGQASDVNCLENGAWRALGVTGMQPVAAETAPDGSLYVVGWRTDTASGPYGASVSRYAAGAWTALPLLGAGIADDVAVDADGTVYVTTRLEYSGTQPHQLWRLDGAAWTEIVAPAGTGPLGPSVAVANGGTVYVATQQTNMLQPVQLLRVDGAALIPVATSWGGSGSGSGIQLQATPDGALLMSASGQMKGFGHTAGSILRYDGRTFRPYGDGLQGDGIPNFNAIVGRPDGSVCVGGDLRVAGGLVPGTDRGTGGASSELGIACWTGARWDTLAARLPTSGDVVEVHSLAADRAGRLYAVATVEEGPSFTDRTGLFTYDGQAWTQTDVAGSGTVVAIGPDDAAYVGGPTASGTSLVRRWDGTAWQPVGALQGTAVSRLLATGGGELWASGYFSGFPGLYQPTFVHWTGTEWEPAPEAPGAPIPASFLVVDLAAGPDGRLLLYGTRTTFNAQYQQTQLAGVVEYANGTWRQIGPSPMPFRFSRSGTFTVDAAGNAFVAAYGPVTPGGPSVDTVYRLDAQTETWRPLTSGFDDTSTAVLYHQGVLSVAGEFTTVGPEAQPAQGFAQWHDPSTTVAAEPAPTDGAFGLRLAPNPARGRTAVTLALAAPEAVRVTVYDRLGREVARLHDGPLPAGETRLDADASGLAPGAYLVRATGAAHAQTRLLTVLR